MITFRLLGLVLTHVATLAGCLVENMSLADFDRITGVCQLTWQPLFPFWVGASSLNDYCTPLDISMVVLVLVPRRSLFETAWMTRA